MPDLHPLKALYAEHGEKLLRYCGVSVINVLSGQALLAACLEIFDLAPVPSQVIAAMLSAIPAYILSRRWVWKQSGPDSFRSEVLPFWTMAFIGLGFAVTVIAIVERFTTHTVALMAASLCAYGVVWVAKYFVLDNLMWGNADATSDDQTVSVDN